MEIIGLHCETRKDYEELIKRNDPNEIRFENEFGNITCPSFGCLNDNRDHCYCGTAQSEYKKQFYKHFRKDKKSVKNDASDICISNNSLLKNQFIEFRNQANMSEKSDMLIRPAVNLICSDRTSSTLDAFEDGSVTMAKNSRSLSASDIILFEKGLIHFFRKVALYWFLCLNCVKKTENYDTKNFKVINYRTGLTMAAESNLCKGKVIGNLSAIHDILEDASDFQKRAFTLNFDGYFKKKVLEAMCREVFQDCDNLFSQFPVPRPFSGTLCVAQKIFSNTVRPIDGSYIVPVKRKHMPVASGFVVTTSKQFGKNACREAVKSSPLVDKLDLISTDNLKIAVDNVVEAFSPKNVQVIEKEIYGFRSNHEICDFNWGNEVENGHGIFSDGLNGSTTACIEESDLDYKIRSQLYDNVDEYNFFSFVNHSVDDNSQKESACTEEGYYLPPGMLNFEETDYPQYDLWCTPLIIEHKAVPHQTPDNYFSRTEEENSNDSFQPYRLWEPSISAKEDNRITNFYVEDEYSVFSMPYHPDRKPQTIEKTSFYSLWGSPNIIDFLPAIGCLQLVNDTSSASSSNEDRSSADSFNLIYEGESLEILESDDTLAKELVDLKPATNELVFTDRGAFQYYRKPMKHNYGESDAGEILSSICQEPVHLHITSASQSKSNETNDFDTRYNSSTSSEIDNRNTIDENIVNHENYKNDSKQIIAMTPYYFKPIQPAFKVETDMPPLLQRSSSGTYYHQDKKLFSFGKKTDQQCNNSDDDDEYAFKPKFVVRDNDKACQTENLNLNSFTVYSNYRNIQNLYCHPSSNQKQMSSYDSACTYSNKQPLFYSLDDVFNFLGKPGLTNIDMKNCTDFDNQF